MFIYALIESDYDYSETHRIAFYNRDEAEKYRAKIQASLDAAHQKQLEFVKAELPDLYSDYPKHHPHQLEIIELELAVHCPG